MALLTASPPESGNEVSNLPGQSRQVGGDSTSPETYPGGDQRSDRGDRFAKKSVAAASDDADPFETQGNLPRPPRRS